MDVRETLKSLIGDGKFATRLEGKTPGELFQINQWLIKGLEVCSKSIQQNTINSTQNGFSALEQAVIAKFPLFEKDYHILIEEGYMTKLNTDHLEWKKSKQCLAEYFRDIYEPATKNNKTKGGKHKVGWEPIRRLFNTESNLSALAYSNGNQFYKTSRDYEQLKPKLIRD